MSHLTLQYHLDHTTNLYLSLSALLTCALDGLRRSIKLPPPLLEDVSLLDEAGRRAKNLRLLPVNQEDRRAALMAAGEVGKPIREGMLHGGVEGYMRMLGERQAEAKDISGEDEVKQNINLY